MIGPYPFWGGPYDRPHIPFEEGPIGSGIGPYPFREGAYDRPLSILDRGLPIRVLLYT